MKNDKIKNAVKSILKKLRE